MATKEENKETESLDQPASAALAQPEENSEEVEFDGTTPAQLGTEKYVHAAFFAAGVLVAYVSGKILATIWNGIAEWPAAVQAVPQLLSYAEDERPSFTMVIGAVIAVVVVFTLFRRPHIRQWADEVAAELYKVHWPDREVVTNGTVVVLAAGAFATIYVGLLDRLWAFITNLVYGI